MTRVMSHWNASTCRSNISRACSAKVDGMPPLGRSIDGSSTSLCSSAFWMRRSMSRIASRYCVSFAAVGRPEPPLQPLHFLDERIEDAAIVLDAREARRLRRVVAVAEQPLEHRARLVLHRQRRRRVAPRQRVGVGAAVAGLARADQLVRVEAQLERRQLRVLAERLRGDLVHRHAGADVGAFGLLRVHAGEERRRGAHVIAGALAVGRKRRLVRQAGDDEQPVAERRERLEDRRQLEARAVGRRRPLLHLDAVRHVDDRQPARRRRTRPRAASERRHHAVEQRQRQRGAEAAQERPAGQRHLGDEHHACLSIPMQLPISATDGVLGHSHLKRHALHDAQNQATTSGSRRPRRRARSGGSPGVS